MTVHTLREGHPERWHISVVRDEPARDLLNRAQEVGAVQKVIVQIYFGSALLFEGELRNWTMYTEVKRGSKVHSILDFARDLEKLNELLAIEEALERGTDGDDD